MKCREFYTKRLNLSIGDTVYYVTGNGVLNSIKKTTISGVIQRTHRLNILDNPPLTYTVYTTTDERIITQLFKERTDELDPSQVFLTKNDAIQYIIDNLKQEIVYQTQILQSANQHLEEAQRVLKTYKRYID